LNTTRHIAIVCNPQSGKGLPVKWLPSVKQVLQHHQFSFEVFTQHLPNSLHPFTDLLIMGGDGTLNFVLNHFKDIPIPIGIIRCGTGNDFSDLLMGKKTLKAYIETALFAKPKPIDAGICNNRYFLNGVGIGFDGWVVKRLLAKKIFSGKAAYFSTVISLLFFYKERLVQISCNNNLIETPLFMLSVANGQTYGGGFKVAPFAKPNDGLLDVITVTKISLFTRLRYLPVIEKGKHLDTSLPFIQYAQTNMITLQCDKPLHAHLDGEHLVASQFDIQILPSHVYIRS
jgi:diacylglycerol kinase (ATP)